VKENFHFVSLGCPKNQVDGEVILASLAREGFSLVDQPEDAGIIVVTTCCFINDAKQESIEIILEHARLKERGSPVALVVCGCLVQRYGKRLAALLPEVDLFVGLAQMRSLGVILRRFLASPREQRERLLINGTPWPAWDVQTSRVLSTPPHYAYIKIAEGCSHRCAFCIIPNIRGSYSSRPAEDIFSEARGLVEKGVKEIILVAQDTGGYGADLEWSETLAGLIRKLSRLDKLEWIRLLYLHPSRVSPELLSVIREDPKCCPYLDIPIQHVAPGVLRRMGRGGEDVREKLRAVRRLFPEAYVRTSLIVGFPGESEDDFNELLEFIHEFRFESLGVFTYSMEEGTPAARMRPQVHHRTRERRRRLIMEAQARIVEERNRLRTGRSYDVMVDGIDPECPTNLVGRTGFQAPEIDGVVVIPGGNPSHIGSRVRVVITGSTIYDLVGQERPPGCRVSVAPRGAFSGAGGNSSVVSLK